jgi:hypothetical protein
LLSFFLNAIFTLLWISAGKILFVPSTIHATAQNMAIFVRSAIFHVLDVFLATAAVIFLAGATAYDAPGAALQLLVPLFVVHIIAHSSSRLFSRVTLTNDSIGNSELPDSAAGTTMAAVEAGRSQSRRDTRNKNCTSGGLVETFLDVRSRLSPEMYVAIAAAWVAALFAISDAREAWHAFPTLSIWAVWTVVKFVSVPTFLVRAVMCFRLSNRQR